MPAFAPCLVGTGALQLLGQQSLSLTSTQQGGAPGPQGALGQPEPNPAGSVLSLSLPGTCWCQSRSSFRPRSTRGRQAEGWLDPGSTPHPCPPASPFPAASQSWEQPRSCPLHRTCVSQEGSSSYLAAPSAWGGVAGQFLTAGHAGHDYLAAWGSYQQSPSWYC